MGLLLPSGLRFIVPRLIARAALALALSIVGTATTHATGVPDPSTSTVPTPLTVSPSGTACFDIIIRDLASNPVTGVGVHIDFGSCSPSFCPAQSHSGNIVSAVTDASGVAHFCICASIASPCTTIVTVDGFVGTFGLRATVEICGSEVPQTMSYQGVLTDGAGGIPPDAQHDFAFRIYDDAALSGAHLLWTENQNDTQVTRGGFNVLLGNGTPAVPLSLAFDKQYYLGISIDGGAELTPRVTLASSPYALIARSVADCGVTGSSIADGQVVRSLNGLSDDVTIAAGSNITIGSSGNTLTISSTGGGGGIGGSGTTNTIPKFTDASTLGNSVITESAGKIGIGMTPLVALDVAGQVRGSGNTSDGVAGSSTASYGVYGQGTDTGWGGLFRYNFDGNNSAYLGGNGTAASFYGPVHMNNGTSLGNGAPSIKMKKLTGTTSSSQGGAVTVVHGLTSSTILSVSVLVEHATNSFLPAGYTIGTGSEFGWFADASNITVMNKTANSANILSKPIRILITYEE